MSIVSISRNLQYRLFFRMYLLRIKVTFRYTYVKFIYLLYFQSEDTVFPVDLGRWKVRGTAAVNNVKLYFLQNKKIVILD